MDESVMPDNENDLYAIIREIDSMFAAQGIDIPSRPILVIQEFGRRYKVSMPLWGGDASKRFKGDAGALAADTIKKWYEEVYGDLVKVDFSPGRSVVILDHDVYLLQIPRILGAAKFIISREFFEHKASFSGPATCNVLQLVNGMTHAKALNLSDSAIGNLSEVFSLSMRAFYILEATQDSLITMAVGDIQTAVDLLYRGGYYGASKWASLQASEKIMKAAIRFSGGNFDKTHKLNSLAETLREVGIDLEGSCNLDLIQCSASIRYGDEVCSRNDAALAHLETLRIVNALMASGAKFSIDME